jgi:cytochrome c553
LRFEVFKRDSFTCQYCGGKAPEVVLHCDHIKPVVASGRNDILNLVTSCAACNAGKGRRSLSDNAVLTKQIDQLQELQERREQIDMMLQWREELERLSADTLERLADHIATRWEYRPNENGLSDLRKWIKKFGPGQVLAAMDQSFESYADVDVAPYCLNAARNHAHAFTCE